MNHNYQNDPVRQSFSANLLQLLSQQKELLEERHEIKQMNVNIGIERMKKSQELDFQVK